MLDKRIKDSKSHQRCFRHYCFVVKNLKNSMPLWDTDPPRADLMGFSELIIARLPQMLTSSSIIASSGPRERLIMGYFSLSRTLTIRSRTVVSAKSSSDSMSITRQWSMKAVWPCEWGTFFQWAKKSCRSYLGPVLKCISVGVADIVGLSSSDKISKRMCFR